jgi:hypothetical protein
MRTLRVPGLRPAALWALLAVPGWLFGAPPHIFFSDLESGPNSGGENNAGLYVTIYGIHFGASRGDSAVTIGPGKAAAYAVWTDDKITFQLGPAAATGDIRVTTSEGTGNGVPFTVRPGQIHFVATSGRDSNPGTFAKPWHTIHHAVEKLGAGDTAYVMDGVVDANPGSSDGSVRITSSGKPGAPKALVAFPGATATIGSPGTDHCYSTSCIEGLGTYKISMAYSWWVIAGMHLSGNNGAMWITGFNGGHSSNWRLVGNDITCPFGDGAGACFETSQTDYVKFYGNHVHDTGRVGASDMYHAVYFSSDSNHIDMGWNTIADVRGCRGVQFHSTALGPGGAADPTGHNQFDLHVHDNLIHDTQCDAVIFATVDPSRGDVEAYNNVIYRAGKGPKTPEGGGNFSCIYAAGYTNNGPAGGGAVRIYQNTMYDCGGMKQEGASNAVENGGHNTKLSIELSNNIIYQRPGQPYVTAFTKGAISGRNNLFFGNGAPPAGFDASLNVDPQFADLEHHDFHLRPGSKARRAGTRLVLESDKEGVARGGEKGFDLGAFQLTADGNRQAGTDQIGVRLPVQLTTERLLDRNRTANRARYIVTGHITNFVLAGFAGSRDAVASRSRPFGGVPPYGLLVAGLPDLEHGDPVSR